MAASWDKNPRRVGRAITISKLTKARKPVHCTGSASLHI